jgi:hypothetical protein
VGNERFAGGDYQGALDAYAGADALMRVPTTSYRLARTLAALGRLTEAREAALRARRFPHEDNEPPAYEEARRDAERLAVELRDRIPSLTIEVAGVKPEVQVTVAVDGVAVPAKAQRLPRRLDPGTHMVRASARGYATVEKRITLRERQHLRSKLALTASGVEPDEPAFELHPVGWVGFGFGIVGIAVGSVTGVISLNAAADAKTQCDAEGLCDPAAADDLDRAALFAPISNAFFIIGGAGLAVGVGALIWSFYDTDEKQAVFVTRDGVGVRF